MEHLGRVPVDPVCSKITAANFSLGSAESNVNIGRVFLRAISAHPDYVGDMC